MTSIPLTQQRQSATIHPTLPTTSNVENGDGKPDVSRPDSDDHSTTQQPSQPNQSLRVVPVRHPWRWVGIAVVLVLLAQFVPGLATNPGWDWPTFAQYFAANSVVRALGVTLQLTA